MTDPADRFVVSSARPAYLDPSVRRSMQERVAAGLAELACCRVCPRDCKVDRLANETKLCRTGRHALVNSAAPHMGEEDCLRGRHGSGTIFFSMCNLRRRVGAADRVHHRGV